MPKRTNIDSILIIGAGPIVIGQACEFDYSGAQACKALREEGYRVILINSNPATIMTDPDMADATYIEPITWQVVASIIARERPSALLPTMGGQTALNCALDLVRHGVLEKYNCELIGANQTAIDKAEDRQKFREAMSKIGLKSARSFIAHSLEEAESVRANLDFPIVIRPSFTLGGTGGGIAYHGEEFTEICAHGLDLSPTNELLIEQSLLGWKEFEMEVVRDKADNVIIVCTIENLDPMGVHTGDSITVAPAQTLTDKEYQAMRDASIAILREIGVETGGSNVQFAVNPDTGDLIVIEMNPRVSRSSALASKATGFPIAKIAAKLAVGYTLDELANDMTGGKTPASFEPTLDYVVTKIPRFTFEKFPTAKNRLGTQMKSVGEAMGIGATFRESLQKALRSLETGMSGFDTPPLERSEDTSTAITAQCLEEMHQPGALRLWYVAEGFRQGLSLDEVFEASKIDPWFLREIEAIIAAEQLLAKETLGSLSVDAMRAVKRMGFSDARLAKLLASSEAEVRQYRHAHGIRPVYKRIDTCAAEFATATAYLYSTYETECEAEPSDNANKIMIIGGGPNRIGQGIEFDYCCVHAALACQTFGYERIMVNCNPETVSTDYDISDRLYFEPLTLEDVLEIAHIEAPSGTVVQYGGQTPLKLANELLKANVPVIGTSPDSIDLAEDRERFQQLLEKLELKQPPNRIVFEAAKAARAADSVGYPLVVRPSYVLGGRAMEVVFDEAELETYMQHAMHASGNNPVLLDRFLEDAVELDVDAIADGERVMICGVMEHIEQAGVHSGDSACCFPPHNLSDALLAAVCMQTDKLALALKVRGLMNVQFAIQGEDIFILEVNPRASRTVPFLSKATGLPFAKIATGCMLGITLAEQGITEVTTPTYYSVKESVFPFIKFPGSDPVLGPEMRSTGEVMGIGATFAEAFMKASLASSTHIPSGGNALLSLRRADRAKAVTLAQNLQAAGFRLMATKGTRRDLMAAGIADIELAHKLSEGRPNILDHIKNGQISLMVNTVAGVRAMRDSAHIRHACLQQKVTTATTLRAAMAMCEAMQHLGCTVSVAPLQTLHRTDA